MHHLIKDEKEEKTILGGKAENLIEIDKMNIVPDFIVLSYDFLHSEFLSGIAELPHVFSDDFILKINREIEFLGPGPLIVRSSYAGEDSANYSYAGIFLSKVCEKTNLFSAIAEVWNSYFSEQVTVYEKINSIKSSGKMGIIIQKYVKAEYGGVMFYNKTENWFYAEFAKGSADKVVSGEASVSRFFKYLGKKFLSSGIINEILERKINDLTDYILMSPLSEIYDKVDVEFIISDYNYYVLQIRPLTTEVNPFLCDYAFPKLIIPDNYFYGDEDFSFIKDILSKYCFPIPEFKINKYINYIDGISLKKFIDYSFVLSSDKNISEFIYKDILNMFNKELSGFKLNISKPLNIFFKELKKFNFRVSFMKRIVQDFEKNIELELIYLGGLDFLRINLQKGIEREFKSIARKKENNYFAKIEELLPNLFFLEQNSRSFKSLITGNVLNIDDMNNNLYRLNKCVFTINNLYNKIEYLYHKVISQKTHYKGSITDLCKLPYERALCILENKDQISPLPVYKRKRSFPIGGITAYPGEIEGQALIVKCKKTLSKCAGKIIIAKSLTPDLIMAICLLSSKNINSKLINNLADYNSLSSISHAIGIVTQYSGIASHAAIIAREFGIPCLVGCEGVLDAVNDGDIVRISHNSLHLVKKRSYED
ncbi:MAG: hypothetical protein K5838_00325 [Elusimicrobiales bacterium]|nr:hypothetical protein [Elusimicrobiales bacterium]